MHRAWIERGFGAGIFWVPELITLSQK